jgi:hypothetical protein
MVVRYQESKKLINNLIYLISTASSGISGNPSLLGTTIERACPSVTEILSHAEKLCSYCAPGISKTQSTFYHKHFRLIYRPCQCYPDFSLYPQ